MKTLHLFAITAALFVLASDPALAGTTGSFPASGPLDMIVGWVTGPVAKYVGIFAIVGAIAAYLLGGSDLPILFRVLIGLGLGIGILLNVVSIMGSFGGSGALV